VRLLDPDTMRPTARLSFPGDRPVWGIDVAFSGDGRYLAATVQTFHWWTDDPPKQGYALVWDVRSPSSPPVKINTATDVAGVALSPDGRTLYTSEPLTAYDVGTGERIWRHENVGSNYAGFDINKDGTLLALADLIGREGSSEDGLVVDVADGTVVTRLRGHQAYIADIRFSPDGTRVGSIDGDGTLIVWDPATGRELERLDGLETGGISFSPDNDRVYNGYGPSMLRAWDVSGSQGYLQRTTQLGDGQAFRQADFAPDGKQVAYGWHDAQDRGWVRFVDVESGAATPPRRFPVWNSWGWWTNGVWHPDGTRYVGWWCEQDPSECGRPGTLTVIDPATGRRIVEPTDVVEAGGEIWLLAYVDGGRGLFVSDSDLQARTLDSETLQPERGAEQFEFFPFCPCGATETGDDGTAMVWGRSGDGAGTRWRVVDVHTGEVVSDGGKLDFPATASVASPDRSKVAVAGDAGEVVVLDLATGSIVRGASTAAPAVYWLDFSDDGELLVSGAEDGSVGLWDAASMDLVGRLQPPHDGEPIPASAQFIGDTHDVAIASYDGTIYKWETGLDRALDFACQMAGRDLTEEEWTQVLPDQPYQSVCPQE
jgi:WD40 repeat protein